MSNPTADQRCEVTTWQNVWHPQRCGKPAKFVCQNPAASEIRMKCCGIHVRQKRSRGWVIEELSK